MAKSNKTTKAAAAIVIETKTNVAKPARKATTATILTREIHTRHITCPECKGKNGLHKVNQPCDFCGFFLAVRLFPDHSRYVRGLDVTVSGRDTYDIGDNTADALRGKSANEVVNDTAQALAQLPIEIGLSVKLGRQFTKAGFSWDSGSIASWLEARYEGRNPGMVRMNCGNILRAAQKREA